MMMMSNYSLESPFPALVTRYPKDLVAPIVKFGSHEEQEKRDFEDTVISDSESETDNYESNTQKTKLTYRMNACHRSAGKSCGCRPKAFLRKSVKLFESGAFSGVKDSGYLSRLSYF